MKTIIKTLLTITLFLFAQNKSDAQVPEQDSLALVALYNCTGGPGWDSTENWLTRPVSSWFGITVESVDGKKRVTRIKLDFDRSIGNNLIGTLPTEIGNLTALKNISLRGNEIETDLPKELFMPNLERVNIENAMFTGDIPEEAKQCVNLTYFRINNNYFTHMPAIPVNDPSKCWIRNYDNFFNMEVQESIIDHAVSKGIAWEGFGHRSQFNKLGKELSPDLTVEIVAGIGETVVLKADDNAPNNKFEGWLKNSFNTYIVGSEYTIKSLAEDDYALYQFKVRNTYVEDNAPNPDNSNYTSHYYYVAPAPVPHFVSAATSSDGKTIEVTFDIPMADPSGHESEFIIRTDGNQNDITSAQLKSGEPYRFVFNMSAAIKADEAVTIQYTPNTLSGNIQSEENVKLLKFRSKMVVNNTSGASPLGLFAQASRDGNKIRVYFDKEINDPSSAISDFKVYSGAENPVTSVSLNSEEAKVIELSVTKSFSENSRGVVKYTGSSIKSVNNGTLGTFLALPVKSAAYITNAETSLSGDKIHISCNKPLGKIIPKHNFNVLQNGKPVAIESITKNSENDSIVVISLSEGLLPDSVITTDFSSNWLYAADGSVIEGFSGISVTNNTTFDAIVLSAGLLNLKMIKVTFDAKIDTSTIDNAGFSVVANGKNVAVKEVYAEEKDAYSLIVELEEALDKDKDILLSYTESNTRTVDNYPILPFTDFEVTGGSLPVITFMVDMNNYGKFYPGNVDTVIYLMGINNDWENGIAMNDTDGDYIYQVTVDTFSFGKIISYTFRNTAVWEYSGIKVRTDTLSKTDTIFAVFGEGSPHNTATNNTNRKDIGIYPNPVTDMLTIEADSDIKHITITGILAHQILAFENPGTITSVNVSDLDPGTYFIRIFLKSGEIVTKRFIKR